MWLQVRTGDGDAVELGTDPVTVGRDPGCDVVVADEKASRRHATLTPLSDGTVRVEDLGSTNGTYVDGRRLDRPAVLRGDHVLRIADTTLALTTAPPSAAPRTTIAPTPPLAPPAAAPPPRPPASRLERLALGRSARRVQLLAGGAVLLALVGLAVGLLFATGAIGGDGDTPSVSDVAREAEDSVVQVRLVAEDGTTQAGGSGWVYDAERGLVVTNAHVVNGGPQLAVRLGREQRIRPAAVVGVAECEDLAVLQVEDTAGLEELTLASQGEVARGDTVVSIGYPGTYAAGDPLVVVAGIVSNPRTQATQGLYPNVIQTDISHNPGNSGGPLLDDRGRLLGVTTLGEVGTVFEGQRYSIGVDRVKRIVPTLASGQSIAWSGMALDGASGFDLASIGLPQQEGLLVTNVSTGSAAAEAGIAAPALIAAIDGTVYPDQLAYCRAFRNVSAGTQATFSIVPQGGTGPADVTLPLD